MIATTLDSLKELCEKTNTPITAVLECIISESPDGDIVVDENSPFYPRLPTEGVGQELKKLLKFIGITSSPGCACNVRAQTMDGEGITWCENNIELIVSWLREEAENRKLLFIDAGGRALVKMAIKRAKRANKE